MQKEDLTTENRNQASGEAHEGTTPSTTSTDVACTKSLPEETENTSNDMPRKRSRVRMKVQGQGSEHAFSLKKDFDESNAVRVAVAKERGAERGDRQDSLNDFESFVQQNNHLVPEALGANTTRSLEKKQSPIVMGTPRLEESATKERPIITKSLSLYGTEDEDKGLTSNTSQALVSREGPEGVDRAEFIVSRPRVSRDSSRARTTYLEKSFIAKSSPTREVDIQHAEKPAVAGRFTREDRYSSESPNTYGRRTPTPRGENGFSRDNHGRAASGNRQGGGSRFPKGVQKRDKKREPYTPTIQPAADFIPTYPEEKEGSNTPIRLNKFLANAGICSRRSADELIATGKIKVNGEIITKMGTEITRQDVVEYKGKVISIERRVYVLLNKPKNCVTTADDPDGRITVLDLAKNACKERIFPVGRLDRNTTGVLLLTNDGDLMAKLLHPSFRKKKIYQVTLDKPVSVEHMQQIAEGIELEDGLIHADAISYVDEEDFSIVGVEIHSGRNRIVRRIFEHFGYKIKKLDRVYFAGLTKKNLPRGRWRYLSEEEVTRLRMGNYE